MMILIRFGSHVELVEQSEIFVQGFKHCAFPVPGTFLVFLNDIRESDAVLLSALRSCVYDRILVRLID